MNLLGNKATALRWNVAANYGGTAVVALAPFLTLPWFFEALGAGQFGLVTFMATLQGVLGLLDAGVSQCLVREVAVRLDGSEGGRRRAAAFFLGFERLYWAVGLVVAAVAVASAGMVADNWLNLQGVAPGLGRLAVIGAACIFLAQFPSSFYRSVLVGGQQLISLNLIMTLGALARYGGGILLVWWRPRLSTYVFWFTAVGFLEAAVRRWFGWRLVAGAGGDGAVGSLWDEWRRVWRAVTYLSVATWIGALTLQMDRIVLSKMVAIDLFGYYSIAATVAMGLLQLIVPLTQAFYPRAVQLRHAPAAYAALIRRLTLLVALVVGCAALVYGFWGEQLLFWWLHRREVVTVVAPVLTVLLVGTALNAFYNIGYIDWLVHGRVRLILAVNGAAFLFALCFLPLLVRRLGLVGGAYGWVFINLLGLMASIARLRGRLPVRRAPR